MLTLLAMLAFAANSVLCRLALGGDLIDAASFASIRLGAGAITLAILVAPRWRARGRTQADWRTVTTLFIYMTLFSFAYLTLSAGTGALVLFGAVQLTMFVCALGSGERFSFSSWAGLALALLGLTYLVSPGLSAPDPLGALLMAMAGVAWGLYSLLGRGVADPVESTANNFIYATPLAILVSVIFMAEFHGTWKGFFLAAISGAVTSGLGYVIWYAALRRLPATRAAVVQLSVPVIAACGGALLLSEQITIRMLLASAATLGGIWIVLQKRGTPAPRRAETE